MSSLKNQATLASYLAYILTRSDLEEVRIVSGQNATLPCRVTAPPNDSPILTLWYINQKDTPVYSFDERPGQRTAHWFDPEVFETRAFYQAHWTPPSLEIFQTQPSDARLYRCRVDFSHSNSRVAWVKLNIIVPPKRMELQKRINPVNLGQKKDAICIAYGGQPPPQVLWYQDGEVVDPTFNISSTQVFNILDVPATRYDLSTSFVCQAINNDLKRPEDLTYRRNVTCEPLAVHISTNDEPLQEGRPAQLTCTVVGSNPPPLVTWYQQGHQIKPLHTKVSTRGNTTTSSLTLNITRSDHDRHLVCRAVNQYLSSHPMEDIYTMNVAYKPSVNLTLGRNLDPSNLKEGVDVFFDCAFDANPPPYKVQWYHEGKLISHNTSTGILVSKSSLAVQSVTLNASGKYVCKVSNVEGDTISQPTEIKIKYAPRCNVTPSLRGVALREPANITCSVEADPEEVRFFWTFNNSARKEQSEVVPTDRFVTEGLHSTLFYTPTTERDYGTLLCFAANAVGHQKEPCSFTVISAGPPEPVTNCIFENVTSHSGNVICQAKFNGGLPQKFLLQVWSDDGELVHNISSPAPEFLVRSLAPGDLYSIAVTSFNSRGAAPPVRLQLHTLKEAEMHKSLPSRSAPSPFALVLGVIGGALFVILVLLFAVWAIRGRRRQEQHHHHFSDALKKQETPSRDDEAMKTDPDILLQSGKESKARSGFDSSKKTYTISHTQLRTVNPYQLQMSESPCTGVDEDTRPHDVTEVTKLTSPLTPSATVPQGIGRGISLGPSGLDVGLGKGFGPGCSVTPSMGILQGVKDYGLEDKRKGCTRRALVDGVGMASDTPVARQPVVKGGESIL